MRHERNPRRSGLGTIAGLMLALLCALATAAGASETGVGPLDDVDLDSRTVVIGTRTLKVSASTEIRDDDGEPMSFREVDALSLWWARYAASPDGTIEKMVVFDPDED